MQVVIQPLLVNPPEPTGMSTITSAGLGHALVIGDVITISGAHEGVHVVEAVLDHGTVTTGKEKVQLRNRQERRAYFSSRKSAPRRPNKLPRSDGALQRS